jgi:GH43 family beta-xylosidase/fibronectin type 3 domain-containing protein
MMKLCVKGFSIFLSFCLLAGIFPISGASAANGEVFEKQIMNGAADPFVLLHEGNYYMTFTQVDRIDIFKSADLADIANGEVTRAFTPPANGWGSKNIWAPKLHRINDKWYLYYTADDGVDANHRMYVLENESPDPMSGTWVSKGEVVNMPDIFAIDGNTFEHNGTYYFVWSTRTNGIMELWIDAMIDPLTVRGEAVVISTPTHDWEKIAGGVNEGPAILKRNGRIFMTFSATGCQSPDYSLGMLTAEDTADLLDPASWSKSPAPVFSKNPEENVYGPGHNSFTTSPDGTEDWLVYHANSRPDAGCTGARGTRVQKIEWNEDGTPDFGRPSAVQILVKCQAGRYEAEDARYNRSVVQNHNQNASCGSHVGNIDFNDSYVEFSQIYAARAGTYVLKIAYAHGMDRSSYQVTVNDRPAVELSLPSTGWGNWKEASLNVELDRGMNTIRLAKGLHFSEVDYIYVEPLNVPDGGEEGALQAKVDEIRLLDQSLYTEESWEIIPKSLAAADALLADSQANQHQLDTAFDVLTGAVAKLEWRQKPVSEGPAVVDAKIVDGRANRLVLTFDQAIVLNHARGFYLLGTKGPIMVTSANYRVEEDGRRLLLHLTSEAQAGEVLSLSYLPELGSIKTVDGHAMDEYVGKRVSNRSKPAPTSLTTTNISYDVVELTWEAPPYEVEGYKIYRDGVEVGDTAETAYTDKRLAPGSSYDYKVTAYDAAGNESESSLSIQVQTKHLPVNSHTGIGVIAPEEHKVDTAEGMTTLTVNDKKLLQDILASESTSVRFELTNIGDTAAKTIILSKQGLELLREHNRLIEIRNGNVMLLLPEEWLDPDQIKDELKIMLEVERLLSAVEGFAPVSGKIQISAMSGGERLYWDKSIQVVYSGLDANRSPSVAAYTFEERAKTWKYVGGNLDRFNGAFSFDIHPFVPFSVLQYFSLFKDVDASHWADEAIGQLAMRGYMHGVGNDSFAPDDRLTRAMFVTLMNRLLGLEEVAYEGQFSDVKEGAWYASSIATAHKAGIMNGKGTGMFPEGYITREEMAAMVMRALEAGGVDGAVDPGNAAFADNGQISDWARDMVNNVAAVGIMTGKLNNRFDPQAHATRAEAAVIVYRMIQLM